MCREVEGRREWPDQVFRVDLQCRGNIAIRMSSLAELGLTTVLYLSVEHPVLRSDTVGNSRDRAEVALPASYSSGLLGAAMGSTGHAVVARAPATPPAPGCGLQRRGMLLTRRGALRPPLPASAAW